MGRSKKAVKARSKRRRELKKHHRKQEKSTDGAVKYDGCTDEQQIDETSTVESDGMLKFGKVKNCCLYNSIFQNDRITIFCM